MTLKFSLVISLVCNKDTDIEALAPASVFYHLVLSLNFTASDSSSDERCFLKALVLIVLQLTQLAGSVFQLSITSIRKKHFPNIHSN